MKRVWLLLKKDALVLRRSPLLLGIVLAYPVAIAILVGLVAGYSTAKTRVALVDEDNLPPTVTIGGQRFHVDRTIREVSKNVDLVRGLSKDEAERQLAAGKVVAVVTVPPGSSRRSSRWCGAPSSRSSSPTARSPRGSSSRCRPWSTRSTASSRLRTSPRI
jgi:ABC-2 type transport system permease protein